MLNAVGELALLNSSRIIPAEFWPDHFTRRMDEDQHLPWWELVPDPGPDLDEEELCLQRSEYYDELIRQEEEHRPHLSSDIFRQKDGIYVLPCHQPDAQFVAVAKKGNFKPFVCSIEYIELTEHDDKHLPTNPQFGGKVPLLRLPRRRWARKEERYYDAHGWRGRLTNHRIFNQRYTLRGRFYTVPSCFSHNSFRKPAHS